LGSEKTTKIQRQNMAIINGTSGNDNLVGNNLEDDQISGLQGNDVIRGLSGNDYIKDGSGSDIISGGAGRDFLLFNFESTTTGITVKYTDRLASGTVSGGSGNGTTFNSIEGMGINTSDGDDVIDISALINYPVFSFLNSIYTYGGNDIITASAGRDNIFGGDGNDLINAGDGNDQLFGEAGNDTLNGGNGDDFLDGGEGDDIVNGDDGNDSINLSNGNDTVNAGNGDDTISTYFAKTGNSSVDGGAGTDTLNLSSYSDMDNPVTITATSTVIRASKLGSVSTFTNIERLNINGSYGNDSVNLSKLSGLIKGSYLLGFSGDDRLIGTSLNDEINGGVGNDSLTGGAGADKLYGGKGNPDEKGGADRLAGGLGDDFLSGDSENDVLMGDLGNDSLFGGSGKDILIGVDAKVGFGVGELDKLNGGTERDTFTLGDAVRAYYSDGDIATSGLADYALISDFSLVEKDVIRLNGVAADYTLADASSYGSSGTAIVLTAGQTTGELIGVVSNVAFGSNPAFSLNSASFAYAV
jgi:Ca2+-binding RTX toxin-like protein